MLHTPISPALALGGAARDAASRPDRLPLLHGRGAIFGALGAALLSLFLYVFVNKLSPIAEGRLSDPDGYMWLLRILQWHDVGRWFDAVVTQVDAPYGEANHWTRLFDSLLMGGTWLVNKLFIADFRTALFVWASTLCPLMLIPLVLVVSWGTRPFTRDAHLLIGFLILPSLPGISDAFAVGRSDHHSLFGLLFASHIAIACRLAFAPGLRLATVAGVLSGLALWAGVEGMMTAGFFAGAVGLLWLRRGAPYDALLQRHLGAAALASALALIVQVPPEHLFDPRSTTLSIMQVAVLAAAWAGIALGRPVARALGGAGVAPLAARLALPAIAGPVTVGLVLASYPKFFRGPLADYDQGFIHEWFNSIAEVAPLFPTKWDEVPMALYCLTPALIAAVYIPLRWRRAGASERDVLLLLGAGLAGFSAMALGAQRWTMYVDLFGLFLWPQAIAAVMDHVLRRWPEPRSFLGMLGRATGTAATLAATVFGPMLLTSLIGLATPTQAATASCDWTEMSRRLTALAAPVRPDAIVLTHSFQGPEVAWRSGLRVVGAPYGNAAPIVQTTEFFGGHDDARAEEIVRRRGVDLVLACAADREKDWFAAESPGAVAMIDRLTGGTQPAWLTPIPLADPALKDFRLFRVVP